MVTRLQSEKGSFVQSPKKAFETEETPFDQYAVPMTVVSGGSFWQCPIGSTLITSNIKIRPSVLTNDRIAYSGMVPVLPNGTIVTFVGKLVTPTSFEVPINQSVPSTDPLCSIHAGSYSGSEGTWNYWPIPIFDTVADNQTWSFALHLEVISGDPLPLFPIGTYDLFVTIQ